MSAAGAPRGGAAEGRVRRQARGGFWLAGAMEKALKALVTRHTRAIPPFIHDRVRLADILCKDAWVGPLTKLGSLGRWVVWWFG